MNNSPALKRKWDPWPVSIIAFFAVAILGCVAFVVFCSMHGTELVAKDYYEQEIRFQGEMERVQRTGALGDQASVAPLQNGNLIQIRVPQSHAGKLTAGRILLYRASSSAMDKRLELKPNEEGCQIVPAANLAEGPWSVKVTWTAENLDYQMDRTILVRSAVATSNR